MRLDRFITLNLARPFRRFMAKVSPSPRWGEGQGEVLPILMYHSISDRDESHLRDYFKVCTSPARFREQMRTLKEHGYVGVDLPTGLAWLNRSGTGVPVSGPGPELLNGPGFVGSNRRHLSPATCQPSSPPPSPFMKSESGSRRVEEADSSQPERTGATALSSRGEKSSPHSALFAPSSAFQPLRPVVITFDDGFQDFFTEAVPVMHEYGFTATMYLPTAFIGDTCRLFCPRGRPSLSTLNSNLSTAPACLTWSEVREARSMGMTFGSHTVNHPKLHGMPWNEIESELRDSRRELEDHLGEAVPDFACPYAFPEADREFCERFRDSVEAAGYATNVTTIIGRLNPDDDPYTLRRLPMNGADDDQLLLAKLAGAYDWLATAQRCVKIAKAVRVRQPQVALAGAKS